MFHISPEYTKAYSLLNNQQKTAVESIEGPVMVLAGPGTGKTQILAMRIAKILLSTDVSPSNVLALTFTDSGAQAMKKRLLSLIGHTAYSVQIQTFHGFCTQIIQSNPEYFPQLSEGESLSDFERITILQEILLQNTFELIKPINAPFLYLKAILKSVQKLKREGVLPESFAKIVAQEEALFLSQESELKKTALLKQQKQLKKNRDLLHAYTLYESQLVQKKRYDFEDMISLTLKAFQQHPALLEEYQENLLYFLVDEYQDTNSAQNQILHHLTSYWGADANVFTVGDPNQSIYRFQGASLENTYSFLEQYPKAKIISLIENYRSPQLVLDAAQAVISNNPPPRDSLPLQLDQKLHSQKGDGDPIELFFASSSLLECLNIASRIKTLIQAGEDPAQIAVIVRNNADTALLAEIFARLQLQYEVEGGANVLDDPLITQLISLMRTIHLLQTNAEGLDLFTTLNYSWLKLDSVLIFKLARYSASEQTSIIDLLLQSSKLDTFLQTLTQSEQLALNKIQSRVNHLISWSGLDTQMNFVRWFERVMHESGFFEFIQHLPTAVEELNRLHTLFTTVVSLSRQKIDFRLADFLNAIELMRTYRINLTENDLDIKKNSIRVITAHKSKGQEWNHVFIAGLIDKKWGNNQTRELIKLPEGILKFSKIDPEVQNNDERRLFYVALTRAKKKLYLSVPNTVQVKQSSKESSPSVFIHEIPATLKRENTQFEHDHSQQDLLEKLLTPEKINPEHTRQDEVGFLQSILENYKLSATALNTYLECGYKFKLNHLIRIPRTRPPALSYGTAIHKSLEYTFKQMKQKSGRIPPLEDVLSQFSSSLSKEMLDRTEFAQRLEKGKKVLKEYLAYYADKFAIPVAVERGFGSGWSKVYLDDIALTGKIDKVEILDPLNKTVKIIDYKTGKPKSRNVIEGKTKTSTGVYKRQLIFYTLLTRLDKSFTLLAQEAEIDFVEPNEAGEYKKESFVITEQDILDLKQLIQQVMTQIRDLKFPKTDQYPICEKCEFAKHCWPNGVPTDQNNSKKID